MVSQEIIIFTFFSYLTGAFPSAVFIGKIFYKIDVREFGSGNAGATNTFRVIGKKAGLIVLLMDVFKGWIAVTYINYINNYSTLLESNPELFFETQLAFGIAAVIGHLFPIYTGFRGGKGIATMLGVLIAIHPFSAILSFLMFLIVVLLTRYVSLASIIASFIFPLLIILIFKSDNSSLNLFAFFVPILSLITHQKNIERLLKRKETKINFGKK